MKVKVYLKKNPKRYVREHKYAFDLKVDDYNEKSILKITEYLTECLKEEIIEFEYNMQEVDHVIIEN